MGNNKENKTVLINFEKLSSLSRLSLKGFTLMMKQNSIITTVHRKENLNDFCCNLLSFAANPGNWFIESSSKASISHMFG